MTIRAVIFDMGGVLLRSENENGRRKWEQRLGLAEGELAEIVFNSPISQKATLGLATDEDVWAHLASRFALDADTLRQLRRDFWSGDRADMLLVDFLRRLRPRYRTAILSNAWPGARKALTERWGLADAVDEMIISAEEGVAKPDPAIYHIALRRLDVRADEAVFAPASRPSPTCGGFWPGPPRAPRTGRAQSPPPALPAPHARSTRSS